MSRSDLPSRSELERLIPLMSNKDRAELVSLLDAQDKLDRQRREDELQRLAELSLYQFLKQAWPHFDPSPFIPGWHLGCIADHLECINNGEIRRLLINIPPRHCKDSNGFSCLAGLDMDTEARQGLPAQGPWGALPVRELWREQGAE